MHVDQRRGDVLEWAAIDDKVDGGPETGRDVMRRARRGRAVRVGTGDDQSTRPLQEGPKEVVVGDTHRHLRPAVQPGGPDAFRFEAEGERQRSGPPAPGQSVGRRGERHAECTYLCHGSGQDGRCIPSGRPLAR